MFKNKIGWQIIIIAICLIGLLVVYNKFLNNSLKNKTEIEAGSDQIITQLNTKGVIDAKLKIIILSTYQCGWSRKYYREVIKPFIEDSIGDYNVSLGYEVISFENDMGMPAAEAAYCANEQGKFWEANDILWTLGEIDNSESNFSEENILEKLKDVKLDKDIFRNCLETHKYKSYILERASWYLGKYDKLGFPTTFFNEEPMKMMIQGTMQAVGAISLEDFIININKELNK